MSTSAPTPPGRRARPTHSLVQRPCVRRSDSQAQKLREQADAARALMLERSRSAYEGSKALLRAGHVVYQYVVLGACGLVCFSSFQALMAVFFRKVQHRFSFGVAVLTQAYFFLFGLTGILLELPLAEGVVPLLSFKLFVDKWLRALSRHTGRGFVYFVTAVLIIDAQSHYTRFGVTSGYLLLFAGVFSFAIGCVDRAAPAL